MRLRTLGILAAASLLLAACGNEGGATTTTSGPEATVSTAGQSATTTTSSDASATTAAPSMDGVHVADSDLGSILVDPDGFTLYVFTQDSDGESACYDACADLWPPLPADTAVSSDLDSAMFGSIERTDGMEQLTVNGMPLYRYTPDTSPGDTTGQGFNDVWFVVDPDGGMLQAAASTNTSTDDDDSGYDYDY